MWVLKMKTTVKRKLEFKFSRQEILDILNALEIADQDHSSNFKGYAKAAKAIMRQIPEDASL